MTEHPSAALDDVVHQRVRLGILTILAQTREADFTYLRDTLGVTDGNLGRHLEVLHDAGYVALNKTFQGRRPRTWVTITPSGPARPEPADRHPARPHRHHRRPTQSRRRRQSTGCRAAAPRFERLHIGWNPLLPRRAHQQGPALH